MRVLGDETRQCHTTAQHERDAETRNAGGQPGRWSGANLRPNCARGASRKYQLRGALVSRDANPRHLAAQSRRLPKTFSPVSFFVFLFKGGISLNPRYISDQQRNSPEEASRFAYVPAESLLCVCSFAQMHESLKASSIVLLCWTAVKGIWTWQEPLQGGGKAASVIACPGGLDGVNWCELGWNSTAGCVRVNWLWSLTLLHSGEMLPGGACERKVETGLHWLRLNPCTGDGGLSRLPDVVLLWFLTR